MRRAAKVDANQPEIVRAIEKMGGVVTHMHQLGRGVADLLVSWRQKWYVLECKAKSKDDLTDDQVSWIGAQRAPVVVVTSPDEAVRFLQEVRP